ncbi:PREDICTED: uncharacterized protein LOC108763920 isoform X1 [Trachymyrmex cornetzi]|uniref:uncharacterized protein LOC108763920 isoform X1 n=2 Tax=Trachymyrmex cornetzi TaxID=471704 RepID=UPI00084F0203|nr:PREDICTED: uncharacterized protein LOC108763920 isoform X1 [Trachymyrmex cornetzi]
MWIICILIGLFQLIILLMLSGILFSVAAVSRLMEITIILIYPTAIFLLRQAANLIILLTILMARMTSSAFHKLCILVKCDQQQETTLQQERLAQLQLDMQTPFVPYKSSILEEIPQDIRFLKDEFSVILSDNGIIEPAQNQSQDNSLMEESIALNFEVTCSYNNMHHRHSINVSNNKQMVFPAIGNEFRRNNK